MRPAEPSGFRRYIRSQGAFLSVTTLGFVLLSTVISVNNSPELFQFRFNSYALLSGLSVVISLVLLLALILRRGYVQARIWFGIEIIGVLLVGLGEVMVMISTSPQQVIYWANMAYIGVALIPIGIFMFVYHFVGDSSKSTDILAPLSLMAGGGLLLFFALISPSLELIESSKGFWGYSIPLTTPFITLVLWLGVVMAACIFKLIIYRRTSRTDSLKHQMDLIIIGSLISVFGCLGFDVIPRALGWQIFPVGIFFQLAIPAAVIYAIYKYDAFAFEFTSNGNDILDTLSEAVIVTDKKFNIVSINNYGLRLTGYESERILGRPLNRLFEPAKFRSIINKLLYAPSKQSVLIINDVEINNSSGVKSTVNLTVTELKGGEPAFVFVLTNISELKNYYESEQKRNEQLEASNKAYVDQQRAIINLLEDSRDLSNQIRREKEDVEKKVEERTKEVQAERKRLEASINSLKIGFLIIDNDKNTISTNEAMSNIIFGTEIAKVVTMLDLELQLKSEFNIKKAIDACVSKGIASNHDNLQYGIKSLRTFIAPVFSDSKGKESLGAVILVEDISEAKAVERSRDEFFSIASHELRTPLTAIRGNTRMIIDYYGDQLKDPMLAEMVDDIHSSSIRLITIVNDFLDTSRLEQGKINFEFTSFSINELVNDISQEFKAGEINPNLYVKIDSPVKLPLVLADRDRLKQTIINLVGNAFKFTDEGGVSITLRADAKKMSIEVSDTGKGIPLESQNLLFRKFQQASNNILTRDSTRSTGLGLYISKLLVEGMNGKIYLKSSKVGKGSVFAIEIPISSEKAVPKK